MQVRTSNLCETTLLNSTDSKFSRMWRQTFILLNKISFGCLKSQYKTIFGHHIWKLYMFNEIHLSYVWIQPCLMVYITLQNLNKWNKFSPVSCVGGHFEISDLNIARYMKEPGNKNISDENRKNLQ